MKAKALGKGKKINWVGEFAPNLGHDPNNPFPLGKTKPKGKRRIKNLTERFLQIGIIMAIFLMITCGICVVLFTINQWRNSNKLTNAQVEVYKAQAENVGKPIIYEQHYFSPIKEK